MRIETNPLETLFSRVRAEHGDRIRAAIRHLAPHEDWEDIESDVWISIWTALKNFNGDSRVGTYVYPIVRRRIADYFRAKYRERRLLEKAKAQMPEAYSPVDGEDHIAPDFSRVTGLLTPAELRILRCLADGKSNDAMVAELFVAKDTVRSHIKRIYKKTKTADRGALVLLAYRFFKEKTA